MLCAHRGLGLPDTCWWIQAAQKLGGAEGTEVVLKAMVLAGGRGKGHFGNGFKVPLL
jgi:hypothetical protein